MGLIPFFITFSINILNSSEIIYIFNTQLLNLNINLAFLITCAMRLAFFIVVSLKLVTIRRFFSMLLLFDSIFIPMGMSIYAYVIFTVYTFEILSPMDYASFVMTTLLFLFYAAYHRIIMVEIYWRKWQLILYKFSLCIAIGVYAIWGIYFIFPGI